VTDIEVEERLRSDEVVVLGRMPWSSNATFLVELRGDDETGEGTERRPEADPSLGPEPDACLPDELDDLDEDDAEDDDEETVVVDVESGLKAVYKPHRGERPLWDFPGGLYKREIAAYELARALGWDCVPETVERDGPLGIGSLQRFVVADFEEHYFTLYEDESFHPQLMRLCAFDLVSNNTDRKGGHVLVDADRHLWGIDHGLSFHAEFKLRTVIWEFAGEPLPSELADDLDRLLSADLPEPLAELLDPFERDALRTRARALLSDGCFPADPTGRRYPWPLV
jgi:uncharacterized repeat protein (TIGR03843 family)